MTSSLAPNFWQNAHFPDPTPPQFVIVIGSDTVLSVAPVESFSVMVIVPDAALSARSCHTTFVDPPAATLATACVALCGLDRRIAVDGVKLMTTDSPVADVPPPLVTFAVAEKFCPRATLAALSASVMSTTAGAGAALLTVTATPNDVPTLFAASNAF